MFAGTNYTSTYTPTVSSNFMLPQTQTNSFSNVLGNNGIVSTNFMPQTQQQPALSWWQTILNAYYRPPVIPPTYQYYNSRYDAEVVLYNNHYSRSAQPPYIYTSPAGQSFILQPVGYYGQVRLVAYQGTVPTGTLDAQITNRPLATALNILTRPPNNYVRIANNASGQVVLQHRNAAGVVDDTITLTIRNVYPPGYDFPQAYVGSVSHSTVTTPTDSADFLAIKTALEKMEHGTEEAYLNSKGYTKVTSLPQPYLTVDGATTDLYRHTSGKTLQLSHSGFRPAGPNLVNNVTQTTVDNNTASLRAAVKDRSVTDARLLLQALRFTEAVNIVAGPPTFTHADGRKVVLTAIDSDGRVTDAAVTGGVSSTDPTNLGLIGLDRNTANGRLISAQYVPDPLPLRPTLPGEAASDLTVYYTKRSFDSSNGQKIKVTFDQSGPAGHVVSVENVAATQTLDSQITNREISQALAILTGAPNNYRLLSRTATTAVLEHRNAAGQVDDTINLGLAQLASFWGLPPQTIVASIVHSVVTSPSTTLPDDLKNGITVQFVSGRDSFTEEMVRKGYQSAGTSIEVPSSPIFTKDSRFYVARPRAGSQTSNSTIFDFTEVAATSVFPGANAIKSRLLSGITVDEAKRYLTASPPNGLGFQATGPLSFKHPNDYVVSLSVSASNRITDAFVSQVAYATTT